MVAELLEDFSELKPDEQVSMTKALPDMGNCLLKFANNNLLYAIQTDVLLIKLVQRLKALQTYFEKKTSQTQHRDVREKDPSDKIEKNLNVKLSLYMSRRYFKGVQNLYVHVSDTLIKIHIPLFTIVYRIMHG